MTTMTVVRVVAIVAACLVLAKWLRSEGRKVSRHGVSLLAVYWFGLALQAKLFRKQLLELCR